MSILLRLLVTSLAAFAAAKLLPGIHIDGYLTAILLAIVLGLLNVLLKPLLFIITLPITLITVGLFLFVINALIILIASRLVGGFHVDNFWWALLFSIVLSVFSSILLKLGRVGQAQKNE